MTTVMSCTVTCPLCGVEGRAEIIASTSRFGPPDLDLRPAAPQRSNLPFQVWVCDECGYACDPNVEEDEVASSTDEEKNLVAGQGYQDELRNGSRPSVASAFICEAMLAESRGQYSNAAISSLYAAWVCDDSGHEAEAIRCRLEVVRHLRRAMADGATIAGQEGGDVLLLTDLLRRAGRFSKAEEECLRGLADPGELTALFEFSLQQIEAADSSTYTVAEATATT